MGLLTEHPSTPPNEIAGQRWFGPKSDTQKRKANLMLDTRHTPLPNVVPDGFTICPASRDEAHDLANLAVLASDGLSLTIWDLLRTGDETALEIGISRVGRSNGTFSYRNADIAMQKHKVIAAIISYPIQQEAKPPVLAEIPPFLQPLVKLEYEAGRSWYINFLATYPEARGQGAATALLENVEQSAKDEGYEALSLIVGNTNPARRQYRHFGFQDAGSLAVAKSEHDIKYSRWMLMKKSIN